MAEVVADSAAGAHAGTGDDDGAVDVFQGHGFGGIADNRQSGQLEGIMSGGEHRPGFLVKAFAMPAKNLGGGKGHG